MEITNNKIKADKNGLPVQQEITYSDPYEEYKATYQRRGHQTIMTKLEHTKKD
ncbi:hypothetical protein [Deinococcus maricopensis]|uniref:Uncharacterized protein n=1 Tax=Deinococcus maricopensis (strain DSM 21211 / LMG 22137 / NRRL B-23946 / LB-34) TaxID=709986 RepID=E8U5T3_DEIML|nr:hypothetical protein [Deinococcus maricopensis]ADV66422.1 hypothetical protein Deima_0766 [Deinococcus maricopensis DSM 21211]